MKKYKFKNTLGLRNDNAQALGEFLEAKFPDGRPNAHKLVEVAKDPESIAHKYFDWDDKSAADKWRVHQARKLINALYIEIGNTEVRAYESVYLTELNSKDYTDIDQISKDESLVEQVVEAARKELIYWKLKYQKYSDFFPKTFHAISAELDKGVTNGQEENRSSPGN